MIRVTIWDEDLKNEAVLKAYPHGLRQALAEGLGCEDFKITLSSINESEQGLSAELIDNTDVLIFWSHKFHKQLSDDAVLRVVEAVQKGMGFIPLHSSHESKTFQRLMGTSCSLKWRDDDSERLWTVMPSHAIARDVPQYIDLESEEMYGEVFNIPPPKDIVFLGWFKGGEVFRSGITYERGQGKIFYFQPGHETFPIYHNKDILKIIKNAVYWAYSPAKLKHIHSENQPLNIPFAKK